jgi:LPS-assembly protein
MYGGTGSDGFSDIGLFDAGMGLSSNLARVYDTGWKKLVKLRHAVVPEVGYVWVENRNQDSLPFFDFNDRVVHRNAAAYAVTNYLSGKFANGDAPAIYRDLAYVRLSQEYDFTGTRRDLLTAYDDLRPFSDLRLETKVNATREYHSRPTVVSILTKPNSTEQFRRAMTMVRQRGSVGYRFTRTQWEFLEGRLATSLLKPFYFSAAGRYAIDGGVLLDTSYAVEYRQQCWGVILSYSDRQGNEAFYVNFTLAGIGPLGRVRLY